MGCVAPHGVSLRRSMDLNDRITEVRGPSCNDLIIVEERNGCWLRIAAGWLPLMIDGQQVFVMLDQTAAREVHAGSTTNQRPHPSQPCETPQDTLWWSPWSLASALGLGNLSLATRFGLPVGMLSVLSAGSWIGFKAAKIWFSATWGATFGLVSRFF